MTKHGDDLRAGILLAIPRLTERLGMPPTLDEIANEMNLGRSTTYKHLTLLRDEGRVILRRRFAGWSLGDGGPSPSRSP